MLSERDSRSAFQSIEWLESQSCNDCAASFPGERSKMSSVAIRATKSPPEIFPQELPAPSLVPLAEISSLRTTALGSQSRPLTPATTEARASCPWTTGETLLVIATHPD